MKDWYFYSTGRGTLKLRRTLVDELTTAQAVATFDGTSVIFTAPSGNQLFFAKANTTQHSKTASWVKRFNERVRAEADGRGGSRRL